ncbi:hypothetical protein DVH24_005950 [Malus domestica]|uniref:Uncharacterized protein n=1 Tax=Malus domestica TaxID=3750 RepID=A0A498INT5_MALDO|nr:hypothetical protein DVH24_005950 [Malus domestica]
MHRQPPTLKNGNGNPDACDKQMQISLRKEAEMSLYDLDDTPLPNLASVEETYGIGLWRCT